MNRNLGLFMIAAASMFPGTGCDVISIPRETYRDRDPIVRSGMPRRKVSKMSRRAARANKLSRFEQRMRRASTRSP